MNYNYGFYKIDPQYFERYKNQKTEFEVDENRPYMCLLIEIPDGYYVCIPFRTNVNHENGFHFRHTKRSAKNKSGLDYSKIVILNSFQYLIQGAHIDTDEYKQTISNVDKIASGALKYINDYIDHVSNNKIMPPSKFNKKYRYTTLQLYHKELGIKI